MIIQNVITLTVFEDLKEVWREAGFNFPGQLNHKHI